VESRPLGSLELSVLAVGCASLGPVLDDRDSVRFVHDAIDLGYTHFVTTESEAAGAAEEYLGQAVGNRDDVIVTTAVGSATPDIGLRRGEPAWIHRAIDRSLRRLRRDWIDHYVLDGVDAATPFEDTLGALHDLVRAGKVRELGAARLKAPLIEEVTQAVAEMDLSPVRALHLPYQVADRRPDEELVPACVELGWSVVAHLDDGWDDPDRNPAAAKLAAFARSKDRTYRELALSWVTQRAPVVSAVITAREQLELMTALADSGWAMSEDERGEIEDIRLEGT
jgi:aryl-alcohol dehydrogenase-like predicted oxidoreductase